MQLIAFSTWEFVFRILLSVICGAAIGFERSKRQKEAGIRTHTIVALGSALMMVISKYGFFDVVSIDGVSLDASRIAANIITGISFVGAGIIFVRGHVITGLTTASGIWATSGVGMAFGAGMYIVGIFSSVLIIVVQMVTHGSLARIEKSIGLDIVIVLYPHTGALARLQQQLSHEGVSSSNWRVNRNEDGTICIHLSIQNEHKHSMESLFAALSENGDVKSISQ